MVQLLNRKLKCRRPFFARSRSNVGSGMEFYDFELLRSGRAHSSPPPEAGDERKREEREGGIKIQSGLDVFVGAVQYSLYCCAVDVVSSFFLSVAGMWHWHLCTVHGELCSSW